MKFLIKPRLLLTVLYFAVLCLGTSCHKKDSNTSSGALPSGAPDQIRLTVNMVGSGFGTITPSAGTLIGSPAEGLYTKGTELLLTATPANSYCQFTGWGECTDIVNEKCRLKLNTDTTVTANFSGISLSGAYSAHATIGQFSHIEVVISNDHVTSFAFNTGYDFGANCDVSQRDVDWPIDFSKDQPDFASSGITTPVKGHLKDLKTIEGTLQACGHTYAWTLVAP